jgi:hypothetical protein
MDIAELKTWLSYDPETGLFTWLNGSGHVKSGANAGSLHSGGYICLWLKRRRYYAHRLAWVMVHGEWPKEIGHINGDRADNRIVNLCLATRSQNLANAGLTSNNTSGMKGVSWDKSRHKWQAHIKVKGRCINLGRFNTQVRAIMARLEAEAKYQGDSAWVPEEISEELSNA